MDAATNHPPYFDFASGSRKHSRVMENQTPAIVRSRDPMLWGGMVDITLGERAQLTSYAATHGFAVNDTNLLVNSVLGARHLSYSSAVEHFAYALALRGADTNLNPEPGVDPAVFKVIADRLEFLKAEAQADELEFNAASQRDFLQFLLAESVKSRPYVFLGLRGDIVAMWKDTDREFTVTFLGDGDALFNVHGSAAKSGRPYVGAGTIPIGSVREVASAFAFLREIFG